jgi:hypothetical protein
MIVLVLFGTALVIGIAFTAEKESKWLRGIGISILVLLLSYILFVVTMVTGMSNYPF